MPHFRQLRRIQPRNYISIGHAAISVRIVPLFIVAGEHGGARKEVNECFQSVHRHSQPGADEPSVFLSFHSPVDEPIIEAVQAVRKYIPAGTHMYAASACLLESLDTRIDTVHSLGEGSMWTWAEEGGKGG